MIESRYRVEVQRVELQSRGTESGYIVELQRVELQSRGVECRVGVKSRGIESSCRVQSSNGIERVVSGLGV